MAHNLKLLFLKNNNGANIFSVKFYFHFTQKSYAVGLVRLSQALSRTNENFRLRVRFRFRPAGTQTAYKSEHRGSRLNVLTQLIRFSRH